MDKIIEVIIDNDLNGKNIKDIILNYIGISYGTLKSLKGTASSILLNDESVYVTREVKTGDNLTVLIKDKISANIVPVNIPVDILYEDDEIIVVNKPSAMPTHPSHNHHDDTLANGLMYYFKDKNFTFRAITRLDRDTSGVVLVAKNPLSAQLLGEDMKNKKIAKEYLAVVNGKPADTHGIISAPIKREKEGIILRCVAPDGKEAMTEYEMIKNSGELSLLRLKPHTGRTHQLRVHLSYIGLPIYGDELYGAKQINERTRLHCSKLTFIHPALKKEIIIEAPIPEDISDLI